MDTSNTSSSAAFSAASDRGHARRVALITGGARRLGAAITESFAARGYDLVLHHGHSAQEAAQLAERLHSEHAVSVEVVSEDLADAAAPAKLVDAAMDRFGALDVVVSSASSFLLKPFDQVTPEQWMAAEAVNLRAPFFLMQAAAKRMNDGGVIIQMSDHLAFEYLTPELMVHQATKGGVTTLVYAMAAALAPRIRVNAVAPGMVLAPAGMSVQAYEKFMRDVPLARSGAPTDAVQAIHFLVEAPYVTGEILRVDGGRHLWR